MYLLKWMIKILMRPIVIELAIVVACGSVVLGFNLTTSKTLAYLVAFALISFLPLCIGILVVSSAASVECPEYIAASVRGLKIEILRRYAVVLLGAWLEISALYFMLSHLDAWPRDRGISTLIYYLFGVFIVASCGIVGVLMGQAVKTALFFTLIAWIVLIFIIDAYIVSLVLGRIAPIVLLLGVMAFSLLKTDDGKLLASVGI